MSGFGDIGVDIQIKANIVELKQAIEAFKEGKISADELQAHTQNLTGSIQGQAQAFSALSRANRVNNFETLQTLRAMRNVNSLVTGLNSVFSTLLLRQIASNTKTTEQAQAFKDLSTQGDNALQNLQNLGPENLKVQNQWDTMTKSLDSLNSDQLSTWITNMQTAADKEGLSGDQLKYFNDQMDAAKQKLADLKTKELADSITQWGSLATAILSAATNLGTFILNYNKAKGLTGIGAGAGGTPFSIGGGGLTGGEVASSAAIFRTLLGVAAIGTLAEALQDNIPTHGGQSFGGMEIVGRKLTDEELRQYGPELGLTPAQINNYITIQHADMSTDANLEKLGNTLAKQQQLTNSTKVK